METMTILGTEHPTATFARVILSWRGEKLVAMCNVNIYGVAWVSGLIRDTGKMMRLSKTERALRGNINAFLEAL